MRCRYSPVYRGEDIPKGEGECLGQGAEEGPTSR